MLVRNFITCCQQQQNCCCCSGSWTQHVSNRILKGSVFRVLVRILQHVGGKQQVKPRSFSASQKFINNFQNPKFIPAFTRARHPTPTRARSIQSTPYTLSHEDPVIFTFSIQRITNQLLQFKPTNANNYIRFTIIFQSH
jgi:hypothetical protein